MAQLRIRNLDEDTKQCLRRRAKLHGRSLSEEARLILYVELVKPVEPEGGFGEQIARIMEGKWMDFEIPAFSDEDWGLYEFPDE